MRYLLLCVVYGKLAPRLLRQRGRQAAGGRGGSPCRSATDPLPPGVGGRRSQLCSRGASAVPARLLLPLPSRVSQRSSAGAAAALLSLSLSLCRPLCSSDSLRSSRNRRTGSKMSSTTTSNAATAATLSSVASEGQGKPKPKAHLRKRGSLQSTTSPGE
ncbi:unnamed protein product [Merluccius merluccius]